VTDTACNQCCECRECITKTKAQAVENELLKERLAIALELVQYTNDWQFGEMTDDDYIKVVAAWVCKHHRLNENVTSSTVSCSTCGAVDEMDKAYVEGQCATCERAPHGFSDNYKPEKSATHVPITGIEKLERERILASKPIRGDRS